MFPTQRKLRLNIVKENGLDNVKGDGYAEWTWNEKSGAANLNYAADTEGFADFSMNADFSDLKLADMAAAKENGAETPFIEIGKFNGFSMKVADEKALDAIFAVAALQMGGTGEDLRLSAPAMIRLSGAQAAQMNPKFSDYLDALANFIGKGGSLEIKAAPKEPVAFSAFANAGPQALPDTLGLEVIHEE